MCMHMWVGMTLHSHIHWHAHTHAYMHSPHKALVAVKDRLREVEGPDIAERMQDQIRQWFIEVRCVQCRPPEGGPHQVGTV